MTDNRPAKPLPQFSTDEEAERFVDHADLTQYDLTGGTRLSEFEFNKKSARINLRVPESLVSAVKARAKERNVPYQRLIREAIEKSLR
jgi:predicted DNA binding CopG/RHH family protein